ncbi:MULTISPECIES: hypothetical protein [Calothrix]|uniref:Uncharacterized protein n=2 Tax=Calothrix TaxID=1186 RepID=A0ABR8A6P9_9CYAN|nr:MULTISPECIES: hypothetical protein [Calothrix]MBD2194741.1 hypothetical protein [Calothrix parietina FACHB-288]MBD2225109.1 hypothetical protein [Calothrix anomala FACHB-343]
MKERLQIHKKADSSNSQLESSLFPSPRSLDKTKQSSPKPLTQLEIANQQFQQHKIEATKLAIQAKYGSLTPEAQERLTVLQAKMDSFWENTGEQGYGVGHNFDNIATNRPQDSIIQAQLTIGQPGDKYEQEADNVAAKVVNQINTASGENQILPAKEEGQVKAEEAGGETSVSPQKQRFLQDYLVAKELVHGIDETLPTDKILEGLFNNFKNIGFKYTMVSKSAEKLLTGTREGDCQTLAEAFKRVAEGYFGIPNLNIEKIPKPFLSEAGKTPYRGREPNCDDGKRWFFQNHYWVTWNNKVYDVLFLSHKKVETDLARQTDPLKSMLMPEEEYFETEKGKVVYPYKDQYSTAELSMFEKLKNFIKNMGRWLANDMDDITAKIHGLLIRKAGASEFDALMQELQNNQINQAASRDGQ